MLRSALCWSGLAVCVGFSVAACSSDSGGGSPAGGGSGGTAATGGATGGTGGSSATGGTGGTSGTGATGGAAGAGATGGADGGGTITVSGTITEFSASGTGAPIAGVQVCLKDLTTPACVTTDASGKYTMAGVPANFEGVALLTKTGYVNLAVVGTTGTTDETVNAVLPTTALAQTYAGLAGFAWPLAGKSIVEFAVLEQVASDAGADAGTVAAGVAGATVSLTPTAGTGPVYASAAGLPDKTLTATSTQGGGAFGDLPPADYTLKVTAPSGKTCTRVAKSGWAASSPDSVKLPAIADTVVYPLRFDCK